MTPHERAVALIEKWRSTKPIPELIPLVTEAIQLAEYEAHLRGYYAGIDAASQSDGSKQDGNRDV